MKQIYLLIITGCAGKEIKRVICQSKAQAKRECETMKDYLITGNLFTAEYSTEHGDYIPKQFVKRIRL